MACLSLISHLFCRRPLLLGLCLGSLLAPALAQDDRAAERAARRQQMQLQQLQQQMSQAQAEKARADEARASAEKQLAERARAAARATAAERAAGARLQQLEAEKAQLLQKVAELEQAAQALRAQGEAAVAQKDTELQQAAVALRTQAGERDQWQQRFGEQARLVTSCTEKNERLVRLSAELLARWQDKGVMDVLKKREPLLGLGEVEMFKLVQEYRDKTDSERFVPRVARE